MRRGFTLIELIVALAVMGLLAGLAVPAWRSFERASRVDQASQEILNVLRQAQDRSLASEQGTQHGVYFDESANSYTLFQGASYALRTIPEDEVFTLPGKVSYQSISFGGGKEVVFEKITGETNNAGFLTLVSSSDATLTSQVYAEGTGSLGKEPTGAASDAERLQDSRHVHVSYSRLIDTNTESLGLTFALGTANETSVTVPFSSNMSAGELLWEGSVTVGTEEQKVEMRTHRLNNPDTQFSVKRDRRVNTVSLDIAFVGEPGNLLFYDQTGQTTQGLSAFVSAPEWQ